MAQRRTVLVVEDDGDILRSIEDALAIEGYDVLVASNGAEALDVLRAGRRPHLILLDLMMPVLNGFEFLDQQRRDAAFASIPVVLLSADTHAREMAAASRTNGYLQKPFKFRELLAAVRHHAA